MARIIDEFKKQRMKLALNLPIEPEWASAASVLASAYVIFNPLYAVAAALALDLLDGMIARARNKTSRNGLLVDYSCDRYSEYIIFGYLSLKNPLLLAIPIINTIMTYMVLSKKKGFYVLPVRQLFLVYLLALRFF